MDTPSIQEQGRSTKDRLLSATVIAGSATKRTAGRSRLDGRIQTGQRMGTGTSETRESLSRSYTGKGEWAEWFSPGFPK